MYSGTTFNKQSGRIMGVHQKIDRVARKHIKTVLPDGASFPEIKDILHFEGKNGPDGIKRKSPAVDEPWHFIDPNDPNDTALVDMVDSHIKNLAIALKAGDMQRAAFEAAWLAHAITDGLTPAHHFPFEEKLQEIRGEGMETRNSVLRKGLMPGDTVKDKLRNNWQFWGAKGMMTMHAGFEAGIASVVPYQRFQSGLPSEKDIAKVQSGGFRDYFLQSVQEVASLKMYETFAKNGWTAALGYQTNRELMPRIIRAVVLGWLEAVWLSRQDGVLGED